jgi:inner membrane transporter RhtA
MSLIVLTGPVSDRHGPPAAVLALASMLCVQLGAAASTGMFDQVGWGGATWLRLVWAALFFLAVTPPRLRLLPPRTVRAAVALGVVSATMTLCFFAAIDRIPLGTASALEFLGPLTVAVVRSPGRHALAWPLLAGGGVVALTEPWSGGADPVGIAFALCAAVAWGGYVLLTQHVGDALTGTRGLAISMPVAAVVATGVGLPQAAARLDVEVLMLSAATALLLPVLPFALELAALRGLTASAFGTLMSLEPAIALAVGALALGQQPAPWQLSGIAAVVTAGVGATRSGRRVPVGCPP